MASPQVKRLDYLNLTPNFTPEQERGPKYAAKRDCMYCVWSMVILEVERSHPLSLLLR